MAMALIEEELGEPWYNIYSELSPSPIAAGNLKGFDLFTDFGSHKIRFDLLRIFLL